MMCCVKWQTPLWYGFLAGVQNILLRLGKVGSSIANVVWFPMLMLKPLKLWFPLNRPYLDWYNWSQVLITSRHIDTKNGIRKWITSKSVWACSVTRRGPCAGKEEDPSCLHHLLSVVWLSVTRCIPERSLFIYSGPLMIMSAAHCICWKVTWRVSFCEKWQLSGQWENCSIVITAKNQKQHWCYVYPLKEATIYFICSSTPSEDHTFFIFLST